jgi:CheY-like chemotaxis protein
MSENFPNKYSWPDKTFLIVEDDESSSLLLNEILIDSGASLLFAKTSAKAIKIVKQNANIHLILMDIQLPDKDGYQICQEIRKIYPNIPVIAQTAYAFSNDRIKALQAGCKDYISKPLDPQELLEKIKALLETSI